jgi:hypothetical protein
VLTLVLELVIAPILVALATLVARRWGQQLGGMLSAFPAIVGPLLLIAAHEHGRAFAAQTASATLLGLVALSGFALAYGRTAAHSGWRTSLAIGWIAAAAIAAPMTTMHTGPLVAMLAASGSLLISYRLLPRHGVPAAAVPSRSDLPLRMGLTVMLIVTLSAAAGRLGPLVGGVLAALPVLACILAVCTHGQHGDAAVVALLRGMLGGMVAFVAFCLLIAVLVERAGIPMAFCAATVVAVAVQAATAAVARAGAAPAL